MFELSLRELLPTLQALHPDHFLVVRSEDDEPVRFLYFATIAEYVAEVKSNTHYPYQVCNGDADELWTKSETIIRFTGSSEIRYITYKYEGFTDLFAGVNVDEVWNQLLDLPRQAEHLSFPRPPTPTNYGPFTAAPGLAPPPPLDPTCTFKDNFNPLAAVAVKLHPKLVPPPVVTTIHQGLPTFPPRA